MNNIDTVPECIKEAYKVIYNFIEQTTGQTATPDEIANALKRYFVLNEIKEHILMDRET